MERALTAPSFSTPIDVSPRSSSRCRPPSRRGRPTPRGRRAAARRAVLHLHVAPWVAAALSVMRRDALGWGYRRPWEASRIGIDFLRVGQSRLNCRVPIIVSVISRRLTLLHEMPSPSSDLDGTPTPRSRVARMTKRPTPTGAGQERLPLWRLGIWESPCPRFGGAFPAPDKQCDSHGPGHWVHWIQHKLSVREPGQVIPVTASVDGSGVVLLEGDDLSLVSWNHRPVLVRAALQRSGGFAQWKPRWHLLVVPTGDLVDGASNVFSLVAADERRECRVTRSTNPDHLIPSKPSPTDVPPLRIAPPVCGGETSSHTSPRY